MTSVKVVALAGGSGSGKSSVAEALYLRHPDTFSILHLDDYFKAEKDTPRLGNHTNWEHPDGVLFEKILHDLRLLKSGNPAKVLTKSELFNPEYDSKLDNRIEYTIESKPIIIFEGYLSLWDTSVRAISDLKVYLDMPIRESLKRRSSNKWILSQEYYSEVLYPMHENFVETTRKFADLIIDVGKNSKEEAVEMIERKIEALYGKIDTKHDRYKEYRD